jgi:ketosteroid isomerase-like protein
MSAAEREILALEARRQAALVAADLAALDDIYDDDLIHVHATGLTHDKAGLIEHVRRNRHYIGFERGALRVRVFGDVAILTGPLINHMRNAATGQTRVMRAVATQVARRTPEGWRFLSFHTCVDSTNRVEP